MSQVKKLLRELIALPSVNPAFLPANDPRGGEQRIADFLAATAGCNGLEVEFQEVFPERANVLARLIPSGRTRQRILLAPHLDTVGGESPAMFRSREKPGRLYGRGACDTKGSVAAMMVAVVELARSSGRPKQTEIVFAGLADEENGQGGSRALVAKGFKADLAIVGEPTLLQAVTAHKGDLWLETTYAAALRRRRHPLLGHPTVSVGAIAGGTQPNIVPDRCRISIDRRTIPGETEASVRREIKSLLHSHAVKAELLNIRNAPCPALETKLKLPLVHRFLASIGQRRAVGAHYFCDAAVLAQGGIPSVVFGPGDIAQAHTADEWISLRQLEQGSRMLFRFLKSLP